jgi:phosphoribosylformylglycinamidine synthase
LGGAVMSSDSFNEESKNLRPTVQVGDPFTEKLLMEACLELFKTDYIVGIQDMGAAGLTSSSFEMAARAGSGMKLYLDKVPTREENMTPYELMLSESQERMLICAKKGTENKIIEIFQKWDLDAEVIGEVTDSGLMELYWHNDKVAEVPIAPVSDEAPVLERNVKKPLYLDYIKKININSLPVVSNKKAFKKLFSSLEVVDKGWIYEQYDSMVQTNTVKHPGSLDASAVRVKEIDKVILISSKCNPRYCYIDPKGGASAAVISAAREVVLGGGVPLAITDCLNYGNPENPEVMWQFAEGTYGIKEACEKLNTPVVSGNVSFYNETDDISIFPTPTVIVVGVCERYKEVIPSYFQEDGNLVYLIGSTKKEFGGSLYLKEIFGKIAGELPAIDYESELRLHKFVKKANEKKLIVCAKNVGIGGIAIALAKMSAKSSKGFLGNCQFEDDREIFSESFGRAIIEISPKNVNVFEKLTKEIGIKAIQVGTVGGEEFVLCDIVEKVEELKEVYFKTFQKIIERDV